MDYFDFFLGIGTLSDDIGIHDQDVAESTSISWTCIEELSMQGLMNSSKKNIE